MEGGWIFVKSSHFFNQVVEQWLFFGKLPLDLPLFSRCRSIPSVIVPSSSSSPKEKRLTHVSTKVIHKTIKDLVEQTLPVCYKYSLDFNPLLVY